MPAGKQCALWLTKLSEQRLVIVYVLGISPVSASVICSSVESSSIRVNWTTNQMPIFCAWFLFVHSANFYFILPLWFSRIPFPVRTPSPQSPFDCNSSKALKCAKMTEKLSIHYSKYIHFSIKWINIHPQRILFNWNTYRVCVYVEH